MKKTIDFQRMHILRRIAERKTVIKFWNSIFWIDMSDF